MNINKGFSILSVLLSFITFNSCINEPNFSIVPEIGLQERYFVVTPDPNDADTLFVIVNFKDGDGDLGFPTDDPTYSSTPFNEVNFYLKSGGDTTLTPIGSSMVTVGDNKTITVFDVPDGAKDTLVTLQTRDKPGNQDLLPPYELPYSFTNYTDGTFYVHESDAAIIGGFTPVDTIHTLINNVNAIFYGVRGTFYTKDNDNYYNIVVTFEVRTGDHYEPFNWAPTARIKSPGRGRFPNLGDTSNPNSPIEGTLKYGIADPDLLFYFNDQTAVRLKIQIADRAMHKSNIVTTDEFLLSHIRKK